jgi:hypothetical protein
MAAPDETQIYRDLMRFKPEDLTPNAWAVKAGVSRAVWADMRRHGNPSRRTLEKLLQAAGSSLAEFEALRLGDEPRARALAGAIVEDARSSMWAPAQLPPLPLIATSLVGELREPGSGIDLMEVRLDELIERLPRPISLASDPQSYAITVVGSSMWPRFRPGRRVAVSPRAPVAVGDDVLISLGPSEGDRADDRLALIAELVRRTNDSVELRQFNPDRSFKVETGEIATVHKIAGELL